MRSRRLKVFVFLRGLWFVVNSVGIDVQTYLSVSYGYFKAFKESCLYKFSENSEHSVMASKWTETGLLLVCKAASEALAARLPQPRAWEPSRFFLASAAGSRFRARRDSGSLAPGVAEERATCCFR